MDPIYLVPACRARQYDGTNGEEIAAWLGIPVAVITEDYLQMQYLPDEALTIPNGYWVMVSAQDPVRYMGMQTSRGLQEQYAIHPGPVTAPPLGDPVTP